MPVINVCDVDHGGSTRQVKVPDNCTIQDFIERKKQGFVHDNYNVRLNEQPVKDFGTTLNAGDRLTFARSKLAGAA